MNTKVLDVYVEFRCFGIVKIPGAILNSPMTGGIEENAEMFALLAEIEAALSPIDLHPHHFGPGKTRHTWKIICWTYDLNLLMESVRKALRVIENSYIPPFGIRKKTRNLPILKRPRKPVTGKPICECGSNPFDCGQVPCRYVGFSWDQQVTVWEREDETVRRRRYPSYKEDSQFLPPF